jgi:hypothetical protein
MTKILYLAATMSLGLLWGGATSAQTSPAQSPAATAANKQANPNEIVCEKQEIVGSRLATARICKTRAQWAAQRQDDRSEIERVQTQRGCTKNGC